LHELFEATCAAFADSIAVEYGPERLTYAVLEARANQLAHHLLTAGVRAGDLVAVLMRRRIDVYLAVLAALKCGAAYVPLDPAYPPDRVKLILEDCGARVVLTDSTLSCRTGARAHIIALDREAGAIAACPTKRLQPLIRATSPAYVIYTSGTTGRPKGVVVSHASASNLVRAEQNIFDVDADDRVYQGFSPAFDASVEEIWLAFASGATLLAATPEMERAGPDLGRLLADGRVSVLSCVPTLLSMMEGEPETVRLLILGGEPCPRRLVERFSRPGRRIVNTYGPTETTVIASFADLKPGKAVTIGTAVPSYSLYVVDESMRRVAPGEVGELLIGGVGVASGYLNRPDLTAERFVPNPFASDAPEAPVLYKTGDLVRCNGEGELEFLGRIDTQVKLRGYRIELAEIESALLACPEVLSAVATVHQDPDGTQQLVGYVVPSAGARIVESELKQAVRSALPCFMVPARIEELSALPTLPSGKIDRGQLPAPRPQKGGDGNAAFTPRTPEEDHIASVWKNLFATASVSRSDHFFFDLGGHSLLAASMVSRLRLIPGLGHASMADVYQHPTIAELAAHLARSRPQKEDTPNAVASAQRRKHFLFSAAQVFGLYLVFALYAIQWFMPWIVFEWMEASGSSRAVSALLGLGSLIAVYPLVLLVGLAVKWAVVGRYREGDYPLYGTHHFRHWLVSRVVEVLPIHCLAPNSIRATYYRWMGASVGKNVYLGSTAVCGFDLISIGDGATIEVDSSLLGASVDGGRLLMGPIRIGTGCRIGTRSVVSAYAEMTPGSELGDLSALGPRACVPKGELWHGSPAQPAGAHKQKVEPALCREARPSVIRGALLIGALVLPIFMFLPVLPAMLLMPALSAHLGVPYAVSAPIAACAFILLLALEVAAMKWLLVGRVRPGQYALDSWFYVRKWFVDQLLDQSLELLGPVYSTLYLRPWYRLLGCKLGKNAEVSTASNTSPDLLILDDESFIADLASLGAQRVHKGTLTLLPTRVGRRAFVGNSAVVPGGVTVAEDGLIGVLSTTPLGESHTREGRSWLGSPAMALHQRAQSSEFPVESTYRPGWRLLCQRAFIEFFRVMLPATFYVVGAISLLRAISFVRTHGGAASTVAWFPVLYGGMALVAALAVALLKWALIGRYVPGEKPLWSPFVWRNELVTALHEYVADPLLVRHLVGTPFAAWFFRLMGAKVGARVHLETTHLTEYDLIRIGDEACVGHGSTLQTHLFEDRVMKMSTVEVGARCTLGAESVALYDSRMEPGSTLEPLSLLMKGEVLPVGTRWRGTPARHATAGSAASTGQRVSANPRDTLRLINGSGS
jgi:non-ribosomal peptide synthetase-like protein